MSEVKSRARDLRRLLEHVDNEPKHKMPANVRIDRERELEACEHELAEKTAAAREAELRNKMIGKYHQVRFFGMRPYARHWSFRSIAAANRL
jgi:flagellar biosynthesis/type III secretory pathway chaperone